MKRLLIIIFLLQGSMADATAGSLENACFEARDTIMRGYEKTGGRQESMQKRALEEQLRAAVGPVRVAGFEGPGSINLPALERDDEGFNSTRRTGTRKEKQERKKDKMNRL